MKRKTFFFPCTDGMCHKLATIIHHYTDAAFPVGGSDCAQATRESLLTLATQISADSAQAETTISIRQRTLLRAAVNWYFDEVTVDETCRATLLQRLKKR